MALKQCKECGSQISDKAKSCPSCGAPVKSGLTFKQLGIGFLLFVFFVGTIGSCRDKDRQEEAQTQAAAEAVLTPEQRAAKAKAEAEEQLHMAAAQLCRVAVQKILKDPESAKFEYMNSETPIEKKPGGVVKVQHKVRAKNSFGAYTLSYFNCLVKQSPDGKNVSLVSIKEFN